MMGSCATSVFYLCHEDIPQANIDLISADFCIVSVRKYGFYILAEVR